MSGSGSKPRVALVVPGLNYGGGVPNVAVFLHRVLSDSGRYEPELISLSTSAADDNSVRLLSPLSWMRGVRRGTAEWRGYPYRKIGTVLAEFEFQRYKPHRSLTRLLKEYDLIQIVSGTPAWAMVTRDVRQPVCLFSATLVEHERAAMIEQSSGWRKSWLRAMTRITARIERDALPKVSYVFAESDYTKRLLSQSVARDKLVLAVPGVDTEFFHNGSYRSDGYMLGVGRFNDPRKNVRLLFDAYESLCRFVPDAPKLVLAGEAPPLERDMQYLRSLAVADRVEIHQNVTRARLLELYRGASIFLLSSYEEGLGVVILEAMACGLPVISTHCGGPATAVTDGVTGYLTPVGDGPAMAERMRQLLGDEELRRRMGRAARQVVEERFSLSAAGKQYLDRYDRLLGAGAG